MTNSQMNKTIRLIRDNKNYKLDYPCALIHELKEDKEFHVCNFLNVLDFFNTDGSRI